MSNLWYEHDVGPWREAQGARATQFVATSVYKLPLFSLHSALFAYEGAPKSMCPPHFLNASYDPGYEDCQLSISRKQKSWSAKIGWKATAFDVISVIVKKLLLKAKSIKSHA